MESNATREDRVEVGIVSIGIGNVGSVRQMIASLGHSATLLQTPPRNNVPKVVVLPGVGAFDFGALRLRETGWFGWLKDVSSSSVGSPRLLGICLGMQLLCDGSEEGTSEGLGVIPGYFRRFRPETDGDAGLRVPHMGWNTVVYDHAKARWSVDLPEGSRYYFVHSFHYTHNDDSYVVGTSVYSGVFGAAVQKGTALGFQFHPEKSHRYGKALLAKVLECPCCR